MLMSSNHKVAIQYLSNIDIDWASLIQTVGDCTFKPDNDEPYAALIDAVAYQQLHPKAGDAIMSRLLNLYSNRFPSPSQILSTEFDALRSCGFSGRKIETIYGIANAAQTGLIPDKKGAE